MACPKAGSTGWSAFAIWRKGGIGNGHNDERLLRCRLRPENTDVGAKSPSDFCMGPPQCHPGVGAQVSRLSGSACDALDRAGPVVFHGNLPALGADVPWRRLIAVSDRETSESNRGDL